MKNQILQGDVLEVARTLADESVNCIITSPPYFSLRDYQLPPTDWPAVSYSPMAGLPELTIPPMTCCLGLEDSIEAYVGHMVLVWREMWRVLRDDGTAWLNLGDSYASQGGPQIDGTKQTSGSQNGAWQGKSRNSFINLPPKNLTGVPWRVAFALQAEGWILRNDIIWSKKNGLPESVKDRCTKSHEYLFLLAKSERYYFDQDAIKEEAKSDYKNRGGSLLNNTGWHTSARGSDTTRRNNRRNDDETTRNARTVWSIEKPVMKLKDDLTPEQKRYVLDRLFQCGLV